MGIAYSLSDDELLNAVGAALKEADRDRVIANEVADHCCLAPATVQDRLPQLADDGRLVTVPSVQNPSWNAYHLPDEDGDRDA